MISTDHWKNVTGYGTDAEGSAHSRFGLLMKDDPFCAMLAPHVQNALPHALYAGGFSEDGSLHPLTEKKHFSNGVVGRIKMVPFAGLWTDSFKRHLLHLAVFAAMPEYEDPFAKRD